MCYYYHYTDKTGFQGITGSCGVKIKEGIGGQHLAERVSEDATAYWKIQQNQPQKWMYGLDQKPEGFYLTKVAPHEIENADTARKLGINKLMKGQVYVLVFKAERGGLRGESDRVYKVKNTYASTNKFYITAHRNDGDLIKLATPACFWCGDLETAKALPLP